MFISTKEILKKLTKESKIMSWTTFQEIGKLKEATEACEFKAKVDLSDGIKVVFPDGWKIKAEHLMARSTNAITDWLTVLWTIRNGRVADEKKQIREQVRNGSGYLQSNQG